MFPELLNLPFLPSVKSYGTLMVVGFLVSLYLMRRLGRRIGLDPILLTNAALYSLMAGIVGARIFYILHHLDQYTADPLRVFAIWQGGLEFLGGVVLAIGFMMIYLRQQKLPARRVLDIMAMGLMVALIFGRIGCLLNGCCWGKPTELVWGIRFPYNSYAYNSQINTNPARGRLEPHLHLPQETYLDFFDQEGRWYPKPFKDLTKEQKYEVTQGAYRCLPVHPSQTYASLAALVICLVLYVHWNCSLKGYYGLGRCRWLATPGLTLSLMLILYGVARYLLELSRDDNPFEIAQLTISQIIGLAMIVIGLVLTPVFIKQGLGPEFTTNHDTEEDHGTVR